MRRTTLASGPRPKKSWVAFLAEQDREPVRRAEGETHDPRVLGGIEAEVRQTVEERAERYPRLEGGELGPRAEVLAEAERQVIVAPPMHVEAVRIVVVTFVAVRRAERHRDHDALGELD